MRPMNEAWEPLRIEVEDFEQLVLLSSSLHLSIINIDPRRKIAFLFYAPIATLRPILYYCKLEEVPKERYVHLDKVSSRLRFGDQISAEPNEVSIPLIKVKSEGLI